MSFVLDTSVILSDPKSLESLSDRNVIIPMVVLNELESKRNHKDIGYAARENLRYLETLRVSGNLVDGVSTGTGSVRVCISNHTVSGLSESNDDQIIGCAMHNPGSVLYSNDLPVRLRSNIFGVKAEEWHGYSRGSGATSTVYVDSATIDYFYDFGSVSSALFDDFALNSNLIMRSADGRSALGRVSDYGTVHELSAGYQMPVQAKNAGQNFAIDALCSGDLRIVSLGGKAGSGKTLLALAAGVAALKNRDVDKVTIFRPIQAVGGQELGYLPGTAEEKMAPWAAAVHDALGVFMKSNQIRDLGSRLEILPLTHIRGRTFSNTFVIVDEAQNLDLMTIVTAMSRVGENSKIVLTHDISQRDNTKVGKHDGIHKVIDSLNGHRMFCHVDLTKSERSPVAELVADTFDL